MKDLFSRVRRLSDTYPLGVERRRSRRRPGRGIFLLFEAPRFSRDFCWPARLVDISGSGLAMKLPPEDLQIDVGAPIYLSMLFDDRIRFDRVPAVLVRLEGDVGGVEFEPWPDEDSSKLRSLLLDGPAKTPPAAS